MLGRTSSLAMIPKSRGIISHHLTEQEYEELMHKRTVNEIAIYLRNHPYFHDSFVGIQEPEIHRERLEDLLSRDIYYKFESLRRYDFSSGKFAHFFLIDCEVHELLYALHLLSTGGAESYIIRLPGFLTNQTSFDLIGLAHARNFTEFLAVVRHTPYYGLLRPLLTGAASFDYAACEHALRSYYYTETLELIDKNFPAKERPAVKELFTREAEIYNLDLIYRIKSFFPGSYTPKEIEELLLPVSFEVPRKRMLEMAAARDLRHLATIYKGYGYDKDYGDFQVESSSACAWRQLYHKSMRILRFSLSPGTVLAALLLLAKIERSNIINIIEGVRYHLDPSDIRLLLKY